MISKPSLAGLALAGAAAMLAGRTWAQSPEGGPAQWATVQAPTNAAASTAMDRPADGEAGPEAREAFGAPAQPGTLNAQYAALQMGEPAHPAQAAISQEAMQTAAARSGAEPPAPPAPSIDGQPALSQTSVALARRVVESAQALVDYMQRASAVQAAWTDAPGVARALETGGVYEAGEIGEGAVAYAALAALQDPMFVQSVRDVGSDEGVRRALAARLVANPSMILRAPGAHAAAMRASAALGRLGVGLYQSGAAVKQSAYDVQHAAWSRAAVADPQAALLRLKARSASRETLGEDGGRTLLASLATLRGDANGDAETRVTPVVQRGLTLAALAVLGYAGEDQSEALSSILTETDNAQCVKMARLNLYQCLSVAGPQYEDIFCLGQHAMMETARCVIASSGWSPPAPAHSAGHDVSSLARTAPPASIYVPVAFSAPAAQSSSAAPYAVALQSASAGR